jgi:glycosyltransferase involved in cell wall biosynthesis
VLIEAVKDLPPDAYELKIFGDQKVFWNYSTELQRQAAGLPVRFMGGFESAEAASVYAQLDVLVVPSLWPENSPLVIHEAYMVGVPVVGSRQGGIPDLVTDGVNGLTYDAFSRKALGQALRRLIDEPSLLQAFAARLPHVKTIEEDAREWNEVYITVIEKNRLAQVQ